MNTRSNLAYDNRQTREIYPDQLPYSSPNVRIKISTKTKQNAHKRVDIAGLGRIFLIVACAFVVLFRGVMITDKNTTVQEKLSQLEATITANEKLQVEIDQALDLDKVETIARDELGMRQAEKYQTVYLNLSQSDYVEKTAKPESHVGAFLSSIVAYLD